MKQFPFFAVSQILPMDLLTVLNDEQINVNETSDIKSPSIANI